jgi:hypothetical protein
MNRRDASRLARALGAAYETDHAKAQTAGSMWFFCIDAVANALADGNADFDRVAFLRECRAVEPKPLPQTEPEAA